MTAGAHIHIDCRQPLRRSPRLWPGLAGLLALLIAGCASHVPERDGPEARPPAGLERVPDAVPRVEPLRVGGPNKPYEVLGRRYVPMTADLPLAETGLASWYGRRFHGRPTSSGEIYDMYAMTAAHKTMPIPSYARVRNPVNGREVVVRINDRGPFADGRVIDLSYTAALRLDLLRGVAPVQVQRITHDEIRAGLVAASPEWAVRLRQVRALTGALLYPLAAYELHRGLQTLPVRVRAQQDNAIDLAGWLAAHPAVEKVHYPGMPGADPEGLLGRQSAGPAAAQRAGRRRSPGDAGGDLRGERLVPRAGRALRHARAGLAGRRPGAAPPRHFALAGRAALDTCEPGSNAREEIAFAN